ncbi:hypothetical protein VOI32_38175 [Paraburkholderia caribensis]|uniref:Uncharacterized protein n=2 Tax=Paraburkholderia TaxID=1822464 RepID=B2JXI4_PARP8|nr:MULTISPECIES: hypothetical protein [Paraburkholderia]ACC76342.1 hypothetical protein Bphy_7360 [Paraburkholderia phymatum STM815]MCO4882454.1 hypothetical protein [Paraburkholderia caribensis]PTB24215.1 hypothetical protein C9I56_34975 [Paraburkholderia caribensis]
MKHRIVVFLLALCFTAAAFAQQQPAPCKNRLHDAQDMLATQKDNARSSSTEHVYMFDPCWDLTDWTWHLVKPGGVNQGPELHLIEGSDGRVRAKVIGWAQAYKGFDATVRVALYPTPETIGKPEMCQMAFPRTNNNFAKNMAVPAVDSTQNYVSVPFPASCGDHALRKYQAVRLWLDWAVKTQ